MDQAHLLGYAMLSAFGAVGIVLGLLWRRRPFAIYPWLLGFGIVITLIGLWLVTRQMARLEGYAALRTWQQIDGTIVDSRVIGERAFRPEIVYQYRVGESIYRDSTSLDPPSFGGRNSKRDAAEAIASEYPKGKTVGIHYNPVNPAESRLKITPPWSIYGQTGFGGFLFGAGLFLIAARFRKPI